MEKIASNLMQSGANANAGQLRGNRMFWVNDYMVGRSLRAMDLTA